MAIHFENKGGDVCGNIGYGHFRAFRVELAKRMDKDLGELYSDHIMILRNGEEFMRRFDALAEKPALKHKKKMLNFLLASDCDGRVSAATCQKIIALMDDYEDETGLLQAMKYCAKHEVPLEWY